MSLADLAQELIDQIIDSYAANPEGGGFTFLSLISRAWVPRSRRYRFASITLYDEDFCANHSATCAILDGSDSIRSSIKRISIVARPPEDPGHSNAWNTECRTAIEPQKLLQLLQRMPRLEEINMYDCAVEPPILGDASSILAHCWDAPAVQHVLYSPSFVGSPVLDAFHTLLFFRNTRIGELHLRGLAPNPVTTYFADGGDEDAHREALAARLARVPAPADLALLRPARVATLDMDRHAYSWAPPLAVPLLATGVADTLFIVVYRKIWGSARVYGFFERMAATLTRVMLGGSLDCESDGILGRQPLLKPCTALREVAIRICPSYLTDQSVLHWTTLPLLPPCVEHFRVVVSLPSIYREPPLHILQTWDKAMNWTGFKDAMRELPRLKTVTFEAVVEQDVTAVRREVENIARRRMPEMNAADMLRFSKQDC
ncbi:hypothetical protein PsYK624_077900 [Phanerochaete sordida]|uniref:Uncharacterized protein n=1 Tax=Phanerochaete sordida TaxID=48140 RepID=A0A9P3GBK4_9APHY|nr:hypothetical protein PsYK624_077900 [Phanerochaete sordida]